MKQMTFEMSKRNDIKANFLFVLVKTRSMPREGFKFTKPE
jgi:hypothetical protein